MQGHLLQMLAVWILVHKRVCTTKGLWGDEGMVLPVAAHSYQMQALIEDITIITLLNKHLLWAT